MLVALLLSGLPLLSGQAAGHQADGRGLPELTIDRTLHDFGEVFAGEEVQTSFTVTNTGNAVLELSDKPLLVTRPTASLYRRSIGGDPLPLRAATAFRPAPV